MHFRPASMTGHLELSTMIGTRAMSGSAAMRFRKRVIAAAEDQLRKLRRPRHVGAFADVQETHLRAQGQRLEPAQPRMRLDLRTDSGFQSVNRLLDRLNMLRGCP